MKKITDKIFEGYKKIAHIIGGLFFIFLQLPIFRAVSHLNENIKLGTYSNPEKEYLFSALIVFLSFFGSILSLLGLMMIFKGKRKYKKPISNL